VIILLTLLALWVQRYIKNRLAALDASIDLLRKKWKMAREERLLWRDEHLHLSYFNFDFNDPEYQRLWNIEIGAEDLYLQRISIACSGAMISWYDYTCEREESEHQE
jgi:hypothetical protein